MSIPRAVPERLRADPPTFSRRWNRRLSSREGAARALSVLLATLLALPTLHAQAPAVPRELAEEEIIVNVRANGVERGEFLLLRRGADYLVPAADLPRLNLKPVADARRQVQGQAYFSLGALGATNVKVEPETLSLQAAFPVEAYLGTHIDMSNRPPPLSVPRPANSAILNYRVAAAQGGAATPLQLRMATELNVRVGEVLLRQEAKYSNSEFARGLRRGPTQVLWDDRKAATRLTAGDVLVPGSPFGATFTAAGLSLVKLYAITPDVIRQPTAALQVSTLTPSQVEVSVDGSTIYRADAGPGPVTLDNLFYYGGARTVRITVRDATGRVQVIEQPYLFTDSVLAKGMHDFSYFAGKRSQLGPDDRWRYREQAWQAFHRYGATDALTVQAGGEGNRNFTMAGAGATLRSDTLGLISTDVLTSLDRLTGRTATGWAARYTYVAPGGAFFVGHRRFGDGFQSYANQLGGVPLLRETRIGGSLRLSGAIALSGDATWARDTAGDRLNQALRLSSQLTRNVSFHAEYVASRINDVRDWTANLFLRMELDAFHWASTAVRTTRDGRSIDVETGRHLAQGEGVGYRLGLASNSFGGDESSFAVGSLNWNLRPATLELYATSQLRGGRARQLEAAVSGAVVAVDGHWGLTRHVGDGFALARLGVPQADVEIFLNNQSQGKTDAAGNLLIPQVGAFGRQDVTLDDRQLPLEYNLGSRRITIAPPYKSGTVVNFGGNRLRAFSGTAWYVQAQARKPVASRAWTLSGEGATLKIDTTPSGEFYLENAEPGRYAGSLTLDGKTYACRLTLPASHEAVTELNEGMLCE